MKKNYFLLLSLLLTPSIVFAENNIGEYFGYFVIHFFLSIHWMFMVIIPFANSYASKHNKTYTKKDYFKMFFIRIGICIVCDLLIGAGAAFLDFIGLFIGIFVTVGYATGGVKGNTSTITPASTKELTKTCPSCNETCAIDELYCHNCGVDISKVEVTLPAGQTPPPDDSGYSVPIDGIPSDVDQYITLMVNDRISKGLEAGKKYTSSAFERKRNIFTILFVIINILFVVLIFFHMPPWVYIFEIVNIIVYKNSKKNDITSEIVKQIKNRPDEDMENIIATEIAKLTIDSTSILRKIAILASFIVPIFFFINPHYIYEEYNDGYSLRFYSFGLTNMTTVNVPSEYKGKKVYEIRGDVFSHQFFLKEAVISEGITNLRGTAFKNDISLVSVTLPSTLTHLGAESFYNCIKLKFINLEDTQIDKVSEKSFYQCSSLEKIEIPEGVTKISARAFYANENLTDVKVPSTVTEIGSSAFRECYKLRTITIPENCFVNERAFKSSPTEVIRN